MPLTDLCECGHARRSQHYTASDFVRRCLLCACVLTAKQRYHQVSVLPTQAELRAAYPQSSIERTGNRP